MSVTRGCIVCCNDKGHAPPRYYYAVLPGKKPYLSSSSSIRSSTNRQRISQPSLESATTHPTSTHGTTQHTSASLSRWTTIGIKPSALVMNGYQLDRKRTLRDLVVEGESRSDQGEEGKDLEGLHGD